MTLGANWTFRRLALVLALVGLAIGAVTVASRMMMPRAKSTEPKVLKRNYTHLSPTDAEWAALVYEPAEEQVFRAEHATEGKIAINEDSSTPIFSPYAGRVAKLMVKPSDTVTKGQPLFVIEATDTVQALNDFITALSTLNSARSKLNLAQINEKRQNDLYAGKAVPLKDWQNSQNDLVTAQNDLRSAETALEASHNRLRILGRSDEQIDAFQKSRQISAETPIYSPLAGTVVQRKVGPGQFISTGASDPVFVIGDLSTVWLTAFVRESEAADIKVGQAVDFKVLALPDRTFKAKVDYVAAAIDPATRRLMVRATIDNSEGLLKPEMFASVTIYSGDEHKSVGVRKQALIYEGKKVRLWVAHVDRWLEMREVTTGLINGDRVEVRENLKPGELVVIKGNLFIDRAASGT
jgi:membrane fusion protein, heavy metal efflux system